MEENKIKLFWVAYVDGCGWFIDEIHREFKAFTDENVEYQLQMYTPNVLEAKPFFCLLELSKKMVKEGIKHYTIYEVEFQIINKQ